MAPFSLSHAHYAQVERDLLGLLPRPGVEDVVVGDELAQPALFLRDLLGFNEPATLDEGQRPVLLSAVCAKVEAGTSAAEVLGAIDAALERRGSGLLVRFRAAVAGLGGGCPHAGTGDAESVHEQLLLAQDALDVLGGTLSEWKRRCNRLELEAHRATRTLERLQFDHPLLDISAHEGNPVPHGLEPANLGADGILLGTGPPDGASAADTSAGSGGLLRSLAPEAPVPLAAPSQIHTEMFQTAPLAHPSSSLKDDPVESHHDATQHNISESAARTIASLEEDLAALRDELDAMRALANDRAREVHERDVAIASLSTELMRLKLVRTTEEDVVSSPWYLFKCSELDVARERAAEADAQVEQARRHREVLALQAAADARRVAELLSSSEVASEGATSAAAAARDVVAQAVSDRDTAAQRCAEAVAAARVSDLRKAQCDELSALVGAMQRDQERLRADWAARITARAAAASPEALAGLSVASLVAEIEGLRSENAAVIDMLERVSTEFESANAQVARALAAAQASEAEAARLQAAAARTVSDRAAWLSAKASLERQLADAATASDAAASVFANQSRLLSAQRDSCAAMDARIQQLQLECAAARLERRAPSSAASQAQLTLLVQRADDAVAQANGAALHASDAEAELRRVREEVLSLQRRLSKRDAKVAKLQEELASASATAPAAPLLMRGVSASSSAFGGSNGGDDGGVNTGDEAVVARLKQQQLGMLQALLECSVCRKNHKDCVITKWCVQTSWA